LEFDGFEGDEDSQYAVWNKQLKKHEQETFLDEIDALVAEEDYDYDEWN
jgi:putative aminopeptidase FrvX